VTGQTSEKTENWFSQLTACEMGGMRSYSLALQPSDAATQFFTLDKNGEETNVAVVLSSQQDKDRSSTIRPANPHCSKSQFFCLPANKDVKKTKYEIQMEFYLFKNCRRGTRIKFT
jgi:hypothetical protein